MVDSKTQILSSEEQVGSIFDQAEFLYLRDISEPNDNALRLVVEEARVNSSKTAPISVLPDHFSEILKDASPIEATEGCKVFELRWDHYVAYLVTEEVVGSSGGHFEEVYSGNLLRLYSKSQFLDYLDRNTGGHVEPLRHYKLICLNHLIDVASYEAPDIRLLNATSRDESEPSLRVN
jgi:hypothetical protein